MYCCVKQQDCFSVTSLFRGISSKGRIVTYRFLAALFAPDFSPALIHVESPSETPFLLPSPSVFIVTVVFFHAAQQGEATSSPVLT